MPSHKAIRFWPSGTKIYRPFDSLEGCNPGTKRANTLGMPGGGGDLYGLHASGKQMQQLMTDIAIIKR